MDIRRFGIAMTVYVVLCAVFAVADDLTPAFLITSAAALLFLLIGVVLFPFVRRRFSVAVPNAASEEAEIYFLKLAGTDIPLRPYVQVASCTLTLRHMPQLASCALLAIATVVVIASGSASHHMLVTGLGAVCP